MLNLLWISVASVGLMMLINLSGGIYQSNYFAIVIGLIDALLVWGIIKRFLWAFWAVTVLVFGGLVYIVLVGTIGAIIMSVFFDTLLFVPVLIYREHFFKNDS